jgi:hypothetical protein
MHPTRVHAPSGDHHLRPVTGRDVTPELMAGDRAITRRPDRQLQRVARREVPDLVGIDAVPARPLAGGEQVDDGAARRSATIDRRCAPCLAEPSAFGVRLQGKSGDDLGRIHSLASIATAS